MPRVRGLLEAYRARRGRELREIAVAYHEPGTLDEYFPVATPGGDVDLLKQKWW